MQLLDQTCSYLTLYTVMLSVRLVTPRENIADNDDNTMSTGRYRSHYRLFIHGLYKNLRDTGYSPPLKTNGNHLDADLDQRGINGPLLHCVQLINSSEAVLNPNC